MTSGVLRSMVRTTWPTTGERTEGEMLPTPEVLSIITGHETPPPLANFRNFPAQLIGCALLRRLSADLGLVAGAGRAVCAVLRALLTYCLFGTSGLGLQQFLSLFPQLCRMCFPQKGKKVLFLPLACAPGLLCRAPSASPRQPGAECRSLAPPPGAHVTCAWRRPWQAASPSS